ncbi:MAG: sel1 repeat family protein [Nannocystaceae bacterium]|nr:sel1 repeat family protein [Nannocystaceae bacterium]
MRLERERRDVEATELASLPDADADAVIQECRRQEQAERGRLLDEAWAAADEARRDAKRARNDVHRLESSTAALEGAVLELAADLERERATVLDQEEALAAMVALAGPDHPCALEMWPQCAEAAASDHEAGEHARAHRRYALACGAGVSEACANWGLMFEHGQGVPADLRRAKKLYGDACEEDELEACVHVGVVTLAEDGAVSGVEAGLRRACAKDVARGCTTLAQALSRDADHDDEIESLLDRACRLDDAHGCRVLGLFLEHAGGKDELIAAQQAFARACDLGNAAACDAPVFVSARHGNPSQPKRVHRADGRAWGRHP